MQMILFLSVCVTVVLVSLSLVMAILSSFLLLESLIALLPLSKAIARFYPRTEQIAVLIPAHNEEICIRETLSDLVPQLNDRDRLVVVADNCSDTTAAIARRMGATVLERHNLLEVGKGYALDYGLQYLAQDPPDVVILIDADCRIAPGTLHQLTQTASLKGRPAQATYLMEKPPFPSSKDGVSIFGFTVKNLVRPLGLSRLGLPCLLMGTGMAFPWHVIRAASLANDHLVEDMKLSVDLTIAGFPPVYCPEARITGYLPQQEQAARSQRTRWEHGHLQVMMAYVPRLLKVAIQEGRLEALALALELSVPPLALLVMLWVANLGITLGWGLLSGAWTAAGLSAIAGLFLTIAILSAWSKFGYRDLPFRQLIRIPVYVLWKIPLYFKFLVKPQSTWVRTERDAVVVKEAIAELIEK